MPSVRDALAEANRNAGVNNALRIGLLMTGVGAGVRGLSGLFNLGNRNFSKTRIPQVGPRTLDVPIREEDERFKTSSENWFQSNVSGPIGDAFSGHVSDPSSWALSLPLALTAGGAGLYGGHKITDWLMDKRRKSQLQSELEEAKGKYEDALTGKSALAVDLDTLYDTYLEKSGTAADNWGKSIGGALTIGIPAALISGLITYDMTKKRTPSEVLRKAKEKRLRESAQRQPPAIYARPQYSTGASDVPTEDEMAGEPLDKIAGGYDPLASSKGYYGARRMQAQPTIDARNAKQDEKDRQGQERLRAAGWVHTADQGWKKNPPAHLSQSTSPSQSAAPSPQMYGDMTAEQFQNDFRTYKKMRDEYRSTGNKQLEQALYQSDGYKRWAAAAKEYQAGKQKPQAASKPAPAPAEPAPVDPFAPLPRYESATSAPDSAASPPAQPATGSPERRQQVIADLQRQIQQYSPPAISQSPADTPKQQVAPAQTPRWSVDPGPPTIKDNEVESIEFQRKRKSQFGDNMSPRPPGLPPRTPLKSEGPPAAAPATPAAQGPVKQQPAPAQLPSQAPAAAPAQPQGAKAQAAQAAKKTPLKPQQSPGRMQPPIKPKPMGKTLPGSSGGMPKLSFDAPGNAPPATPVEVGGKPPYGVDGPALGGAASQTTNPIGPGSASNHPMNTARSQPSQGLLSGQWGGHLGGLMETAQSTNTKA